MPTPAPRRVLITGASGGLGAALATALCGPGDIALLHYHHHREAAAALATRLTAQAAVPHLLEADLGDAHQRAALPERVLAEFGGCDVLVNNAGAPLRAHTLAETTEDDVAAIMGLNFTAALMLCQGLFPMMCAQGYGRIVNISSIGVKFGGGRTSLVYSAAKAALETITVNLAREGAAHQVLVNTVRAGVMATAAFKHFPKDLAARQQLIPLQRLGEPAEVAALVAYLIGPQGGFVTGQTLAVSGGE